MKNRNREKKEREKEFNENTLHTAGGMMPLALNSGDGIDF